MAVFYMLVYIARAVVRVFCKYDGIIWKSSLANMYECRMYAMRDARDAMQRNIVWKVMIPWVDVTLVSFLGRTHTGKLYNTVLTL